MTSARPFPAWRQRTKNINLYVELRNGKCLVEFLHFLKVNGLSAENLQSEHSGISSDTAIIFTLKSLRNISHEEMMALIESNDCVSYIEEL